MQRKNDQSQHEKSDSRSDDPLWRPIEDSLASKNHDKQHDTQVDEESGSEYPHSPPVQALVSSRLRVRSDGGLV
jgi:hypothetical protein